MPWAIHEGRADDPILVSRHALFFMHMNLRLECTPVGVAEGSSRSNLPHVLGCQRGKLKQIGEKVSRLMVPGDERDAFMAALRSSAIVYETRESAWPALTDHAAAGADDDR